MILVAFIGLRFNNFIVEVNIWLFSVEIRSSPLPASAMLSSHTQYE